MYLEKLFDDAKKSLNKLRLNDVLERMGLQLHQKNSRRSVPMIVAFGTGIALGAGALLFFAPQSGKDARQNVGQWIGEAWKGLIGKAAEADAAIEKTATTARSS